MKRGLDILGELEYSLSEGVWDEKTRTFTGKNFSYGYDFNEIEHNYDDYYLRKYERSSFGKDYNSKIKTAEIFCEMLISSMYESYLETKYEWNFVKFKIQFNNQLDFEKFWDTINIPIEYNNTDNEVLELINIKKWNLKLLIMIMVSL